MFRKIFITTLLAVVCWTVTLSQTDQRTRETKIADIIMQLPAGNTADYNRLMAELYQLDNPVAYLAPLLAEPGGNDAQIRHAIGGLAKYASQKESLKAPLAKSLATAILQAKSDEIRDFLFIQLQFVAGTESVETAAKYLGNDRLCDAAARVLVRIGTDASAKTLLDALTKAKGTQQISLVQALGELRCQKAAPVIASLLGSGDANLQKAVLYSLSSIADLASDKLLYSAVASANFKYEPTNALQAYIRYLANIGKVNPSFTAKAAQNLLKATSEDTQIAAKTAALELYVTATGNNAVADIIAALDSKQKAYREAALNYSTKITSPKMYDALIKRAKTEKDAQKQAELIATFGKRGDKAALPFVTEQMFATNLSLRQAAIVAGAQLNAEESIRPIIRSMNSGDEKTVATGKTTLLGVRSWRVKEEVAAAIPQASVSAKIAFLEILAARQAFTKIETVYAQTSSTDAAVRLAAETALSSLVSEKDIPAIAALLNVTAQPKEIEALQKALYAAVSELSQDQQTLAVLTQINFSKRPEVYYNVLAMIGGKYGLIHVLTAFRSNDAAVRGIAFDALLQWSDELVIPTLYHIAKANTDSYTEKALTAYIDKSAASKQAPEQKLILLRNALEINPTAGQKQKIIKQIGNTGTFLGLLTAGKYLTDHNESTQQAAVQAVRTIALSHPQYYGALVTDIIKKAIEVNKDAEASYQKQALLKHLEALPKGEGFVSMFNGKDLTGWKGLVENPIARSKMTPKQLAEQQKKADERMIRDWHVNDGMLVFEGSGYDNLCSAKDYADFEMYVDWRITPKGDAGLYLRGTPQVQIWDISRVEDGAQVGSGGLYNNAKPVNRSTPLVVADNPVDEWNSFYIKMIGEKVTVYLNGQLVTDNITLENYWDRSLPIFPKDAIELQAHGTRVEYRDLYIREIPRPEAYKVSATEAAEGFVPLFNGIDMSGWTGNLKDYFAKDGNLVCEPKGGHGNIYTDREYADFILRFDFQLTPAANNGLGIRTPLEGDAAYTGMELQILDNEADVYKTLQPYQYHGSVYGVMPAKRGYLKPVGEWNTQEVIAKGNHITITLNGTVIVDGDIAAASKNFTETADHLNHPGLSNKSGYIGFLGHGSPLTFRNLRIKDLSKTK
ncbi:MAG: DUF1080 domain-containing protein [Bacteroidales bacterium]|jgi:hypothetical protein|nr:DUF1080 domain-containing protein [Bacteroidales bacterium]